jgi:release factor glutamine methyltransferase
MRAGVTLEEGAKAIHAQRTRAQALAGIRSRLERAGVPSPESEAEWLLLHVLRISRAAYWSDPRRLVRPDEDEALDVLASRRERREPLQHLLGEVPFHGVVLGVQPGVFIPRPETEELVEAVLALNPPAQGALLDWGTGTGAIAIGLLKALSGWTAVAADRSVPALDLAARNATKNGVGGRFRSLEGDFGLPRPQPIHGAPFDMVVSNPPYIRRGDLPGLAPEVRDHDPREALDGGDDGLDAHRHLARGLRSWLKIGGLLALEIGADQADDVLRLFGAVIRDARVLPDRAGLPRIVVGTMRGGGA